VILIVLAIRLFKTLHRVDEVVDNVNNKMQKLDGVIDTIDSSMDMISSVGNKIASFLSTGIINTVINLFKNRKNKKGIDEEDE